MSSTDILGEFRAAFEAVSERGILGGLFVAIVGFLAFLGVDGAHSPDRHFGWLFAAYAVVGMILTGVTYELLLPALSFLAKPLTEFGYRRVTGTRVPYGVIRETRERLLVRGPSHVCGVLNKELRLRQNATYYLVSGLVALVVVRIHARFLDVDPRAHYICLLVCIYVAGAAMAGLLLRSISLGRSIALAERVSVDQEQQNR